ncbi:MAG: amino acid adenylation domain-containing protein [Sulfitobacter sp.]
MTNLKAVNLAAVSARLKAGGFERLADTNSTGRPKGAAPCASAAERRFWIQEQLDPTSRPNTLGYWLDFDHPVPPAALRAALSTLIARHEVLRSTYTESDGILHVSVAPGGAPPIGLALDSAAPNDLSAALNDMRLSMTDGPVWQVRPLLREDDIAGILIGTHHSVMDWAAIETFINELLAVLAGTGLGPAQQTLDHTYRHDQELLPRLDAMKRYWTKRLENCPAELSLPTAAPSREHPTPTYAAKDLTIDANRAARLKSCAAKFRATPHTIFLAAYGIVLSRLSLSADLVVGTAVSTRAPNDTASTLGCLSDLVPLRLSLEPQSSIAQTIAQLRTTCAEDIENAPLGLSDIAACAGIARRGGKAPLVQAIFNLLPEWQQGAGAKGHIVHSPIARADIVLEVRETAGFDLRLELRSGIGPDGLLSSFLDCLDAVLAAFEKDGSTPLRNIPLPAAMPQIPSAPPLPATDLGQFLFNRLKGRTGPAIVTQHATLSFSEIKEKAEAMAKSLLRAGLKPGDPVAVHLPRGADLVISTLACLRAGTVLVLLDPANPVARRRDILRSSGARYLIAWDLEPELRDCVETVASPAPSANAASPADWPRRKPTDTAYIVFTSGSTGKPKGVLGTHAGLINRLLWLETAYPSSQNDIALLKTSPSFVDFFAELLGPIASGIPLVIANDAQASDPLSLSELILARSVTRITAVPSVLRSWLDHVPDFRARFASLRLCISSGEALTPPLANRFKTSLPDCDLINLYGSSEVAGDVTFHEVAKGLDPLPIGRALSGNAAAVVDPAGRALPPGFPGEVAVAGIGLAAGYNELTALTAERFCATQAFANQRAFRTGDLGVLDNSGLLYLLGRLDNQIKIDGVRVEISEVEGVIEAIASVKSCAVIPSLGSDGAPRLTAFVTGDPQLRPGTIRDIARRRLLGSMVPGRIIILNALPLGSTGKIDRKALEKLAGETQSPEPSLPPAQTPLTHQIADIWADVLNTPKPNANADFFQLGGTSLRAIVAMSKIGQLLGRVCNVALLFENPRLGALVNALSEANLSLPLPKHSANPDQGELTANQRWLWRAYRDTPNSVAYNLAANYKIGGALDLTAFAKAVSGVFANHNALRTRFIMMQDTPAYHLADVPTPEAAITVINDATTPANDLLQNAVQRPFALDQEYPARFTLYRRNEGYLLILALHHVATDGWSAQVILDELSKLYRHFTKGTAELPPAVLQIGDFSQWQKTIRPELEPRLSEYLNTIANVQGPHLLGVNSPPKQTGPAARVTVDLAGDQLARIAAAAGDTRINAFTVSCAAWALVLRGFSGDAPFLIGVPHAGRAAPGLDRVVGFLANTVLLALHPDPADPWQEVLHETHEALLLASRFEHLPLDWVTERGSGWSAKSDEIRTMVIPQDGFNWQMALEDVEVAEISQAATPQARVDLSLNLQKTPDGHSLEIEYDVTRLPKARITALARALSAILNTAQKDDGPSQRNLPLSGPNDPAAFLNSPDATPGLETRIDQVLAKWAQQDPGAIATQGFSTQLPASQLDMMVTAKSNLLINAGYGAGSVIALAAERGPDWLVALLAIWRAKATAVIIDITWPEDRKAQIYEDASVDLILQSTLLTSPPKTAPVKKATTCANTAAALVYTSGTTGRPKAVAIDHAALVRLGTALAETLLLAPGDRVLQAAAPAFDVALSDIAMAICGRACLFVLPQADVMAGRHLRDTLRDNRITHMQVAAAVLSATDVGTLPDLRVVAVGGEVCPHKTLCDWSEGRALFILYGPTETTVTASVARFDANLPVAALGRPIAGSGIAILNAAGQVQPAGIAGELVVTGNQVAKYAGHAAQTQSSFDQATFLDHPSAMYRTGDRAWLNDDGHLIFLGRADRQIKIRGTRIEPASIEELLETHADIRRAFVAAPPRTDHRSLVAWILPHQIIDITALRLWLGAKLPAAMVPDRFILLETLPLTANGKVDWQALPTPPETPIASDPAPFTRPTTLAEMEQHVALVWARTLKRKSVPHNLSFYDCGGNSLLIIELQTELEKTLEIAIQIGDLFSNPTVTAMAALLWDQLTDLSNVEFEL